MEPRKVIITIEAKTDIPIKILRNIRLIDVVSGYYGPIVKDQIKQVQVNVIKKE